MANHSVEEWRWARRSDAGALQIFACACPEKPYKSAETRWRPYHPRRWEYDAQCMIRAAKVPDTSSASSDRRRVLVGVDDEGLAAVLTWVQNDGPGCVYLEAGGVAVRHRSQGGDVARRMMREAMERIESEAQADSSCLEMVVTGNIWHENKGSQRMCWDTGLRTVDSGLEVQTWTLRLSLVTEEE